MGEIDARVSVGEQMNLMKVNTVENLASSGKVKYYYPFGLAISNVKFQRVQYISEYFL